MGTYTAIALISLIIGAISGWFLKNSQAKAEEQRLRDSFFNLSREALQQNNESFLELAKTKFDVLKAENKAELDIKKTAIEGDISGLKTQLTKYETLVRGFETDRENKYGSLTTQMGNILSAETRLNESVKILETALKNPQARGRWGEIQLKRVIEMAGMSEHVDFIEQETIQTEDGSLRPDVIINLPAVRKIVIDSKTPHPNYFRAVEAKTEEDKKRALTMYLTDVKTHIGKLSSKAYWEQIPAGAPFVIMFLPGEALIRVALEQDINLLEDALKKKIILASPSTLLAVLLIVERSWQDSKISEHMEEIKKEGGELISRLGKFISHMINLRTGLNKARAC